MRESRDDYPASWYAATANPAPKRPRLEGDRKADVCIVGAGFTGCHTALNLAERGYSVIVLEAGKVGWGASGRNGGQICTGFNHGMEPIEEDLGLDGARRLFDMAEEAKGILAERIERYAIQCDLKWGYLIGAERKRQLEECKEDIEESAGRYGYEKLRLLEGEDFRRHVDSPAYVGGLYDAGAGQLHPLNYCLGLAAAAESQGATVYEASAVTAVEPGRPAKVKTAQGSVTADFVVLACNAYLDGLDSGLQAKIMPVGTYITATETLGENRAAGLIPGGEAVGDYNFVTNYFRRSPDHRLLFGGGVSYTAAMPDNLPAQMRKSMLKIFPQLADVKQDFTWGGFVAITMNRKPHLGRTQPNVFFAQGFSGMGVSMTGIAARVMSEAIAGQSERFDLFGAIKHKTFPGGRLLRMPTLALAMLWFRLRDKI